MTRDFRTDRINRDAVIDALESGNYHQMYGGGTGSPDTGAYVPPAGSSFDDLTRDYRRREEGAGGVGRGAMSGASAGAMAGSVLPGFGTIAGGLIGGIGGGIAGAFTKNAESAYTDFGKDDAYAAVGDAYKSYLGRDGSPDEINAHLANQGLKPGDRWVGEDGLRYVIDAIRNSDEARGYTPQAAGGPAAPGAPAAPGTETPAASAPGGQFTGGSGALVDPYTLAPEEELAGAFNGAQQYGDYDASTGRTGRAAGGLDGYAAHGFDFGQDPGNRDLGKSAKYAFTHFAQQAATNGAPMPTTKEGAQAWFQEHVAPGLNQMGYTVHEVVGDKAFISTREFPQGQWVDFLSNAGGDNPALWWGAEDPNAPAGGGAGTGGGGGGMDLGSLATADITSGDLFEQLLQQARAAAGGGGAAPVSFDRNALINRLAS